MSRLALFCGALLAACPLAAVPLPSLKVRPQVIDATIRIGYGLALADVDGDGRTDILLADAKQVVWYRAPQWEKFLMTEALTKQDHVCLAARDLDGDGKAEVAVGAEWNPNDTVNSGAVFLLDPPADRTQRWTPRRLPHEPTTHRMHWVKTGPGQALLAVLPLHGRGNRNGAGAGVKLLGYAWPWREESQPAELWTAEPALHLTHNFDLLPADPSSGREALLVATKEGVQSLAAPSPGAIPRGLTTAAAGEVRQGRLPGGRRFTTTIEPMHGNQLVIYPEGAPAGAERLVVDETLIQGHGLATGDLLGIGSDQIVAGWRGATPGQRVGIRLFAPGADGASWKLHGLIDDNTMACEDLKVADLDGDGKPDVVAAGRATRNVVIYWNETHR